MNRDDRSGASSVWLHVSDSDVRAASKCRREHESGLPGHGSVRPGCNSCCFGQYRVFSKRHPTHARHANRIPELTNMANAGAAEDSERPRGISCPGAARACLKTVRCQTLGTRSSVEESLAGVQRRCTCSSICSSFSSDRRGRTASVRALGGLRRPALNGSGHVAPAPA